MLISVISIFTLASCRSEPEIPETRIVGYYTAWSVEHGYHVADIPARSLTHVNYAFSNVSSTGECILGYPEYDVEMTFTAQDSVTGKEATGGHFEQLVQLKLEHPHLKTLISIGGWTWSSEFSNAALTDASRQKFVRSCVKLYIEQYPGVFDGIDLDWEYPVSGGLVEGRPEDTQNFTLLLAEFRRQLDKAGKQDDKHYLLTIAAPAHRAKENMEIAKIISYLDWINIMTYDIHGPWDDTTNFNAPLFETTDDQSGLTVDKAVHDYLQAGVSSDKLVMGVPFYGRGWQGVPSANNGLYQKTRQGAAQGTWEPGNFDYSDLVQNYMPTYTRFWQDEAKVPWLYSPFTGIMITYDDPEALTHKATYIREQNLGGAMIWDLSADDGTLIEALASPLRPEGEAAEFPSPPTPAPTILGETGSGVFFDDFDYGGINDPHFRVNAWVVRTSGMVNKIGVAQATWPITGVMFLDDPTQEGNRLMQLSASTDGTPTHTLSAEVGQARKFYSGTYVSRVRFTDEPVYGPDGDEVVQAFFTHTPLYVAEDPNYGEMDVQYLPNGGWWAKESTTWFFTWETYRPSPWSANKKSKNINGSQNGWHTILIHVADGEVTYFIDGQELVRHYGHVAPETPMFLNYNIWFVDGKLLETSDPRAYVQQVDWLYYAGNQVLTLEQVEAQIEEYRTNGVRYENTVPVSSVSEQTNARKAGTPRPFETKINQVNEITIDGDLEEWTGDPTFTLNEAEQVVYAAGTWGGPEDLSAQAWVGWADDGLYLAFKVMDDNIVQDWTSGALWQGDYIELQIDTQLEGDFDDTEMGDDDYQIGITPGNFDTTQPDAAIWYGLIEVGDTAKLEHAAVQTDDGYDMEVFVPKEILRGLNLSTNTMIGLNVNPSDCDDPAAPQKIMLSTSPIRSLTDPTTFGKAVLIE
ncbi:MAG: hypothetical protein GY832_09295 [Chloroflexi bacterium]|nr:hypothetical protein [Chloroflexota bacterium]